MRYCIVLSLVGSTTVYVEADSEAEAVEKAVDETGMDDFDDVEIEVGDVQEVTR